MSRFQSLSIALIVTACVAPQDLHPRSTLGEVAKSVATERPATRDADRLPVIQELPAPLISGAQAEARPQAPQATRQNGDISLDFADTDVRDVIAEILGRQLGANYIVDPAVRGSVTLHTAVPLGTGQLVPVLKSILAQNGATLVEGDGIYRVMPAGGPGGGPAILAGTTTVPLRFAIAEDLARVLQPFVGPGGRIVAEASRNALIIASEGDTRETLIALAKSFDVDMLSGQAYALFPVISGGVKDFAAALQEAFHNQPGTGDTPRASNLGSFVRVVPMERINAVLIVSTQVRYIDEARRIYAIVDRARRQNIRSWHVTYLHNSDVSDIAYTLQTAFTPNNITVQPHIQVTSPFSTSQGSAQRSSMGSTGAISGSLGQSGGLSAGTGGGIGTQGLLNSGNQAPQQQPVQQQAQNPNPLLGGLDPLGGAGNQQPEALRIVANEQNNALLVYATMQEYDLVTAMLRKIDILPRQVRIDATIAEVTLNDQLQYGTQFFFRSGGVNGALSYANAPVSNPTQPTFASQFPGFFLGGRGLGGAPVALNALQAVTTVNVLSSPQILVVDNQVARLQVGNMVPYLSQTSQSTISAGAPVINSINYQQTGVIMQIKARINSGGLVTLDISQEVSDVNTDPTTATAGINSPTFLERNISSRVVVQDGQTVGLAGLIRDNSSRGNEGLPWLKDIPVLGLLAGKQDNTRSRTELLVLITPHVVEDRRDARALTEDMLEQLGAAAAVPGVLRQQPPSGSNDPGKMLRQRSPGSPP